MGIKFTDNALTTLAGNISDVATTLAVAASTGDNFPQVTGGGSDFFVVTMENSSGDREFIRVDHRAAASDTLGSGSYPLQRGYWGSTALAWNAGDSVDLRMSANVLDLFVTGMIGANNLSEITSAATARSNIGAAASGANTDITSLGGLTTPIPLTGGGTGGDSASAARSNLGLGDAAQKNVGTAAGTVAAGDHSHGFSDLSGSATAAQGGTGITSYTAGDIIYASGTTTLTKLAKGTAYQLNAMNAGATAPAYASLGTIITNQTAETSPDVADEIALYDASAAGSDKITLGNMLKVIDTLTADASPDTAADYVVTYDASAGAAKKVLLNLVGLPAASAAQMEAASSNTVAVTPGVQHRHPGHPKVMIMVHYDSGGTPPYTSVDATLRFGFSSISGIGAFGTQWTINFAAFSSSEIYAIQFLKRANGSTIWQTSSSGVTAMSTSSISYDDGGDVAGTDYLIIGYGDL